MLSSNRCKASRGAATATHSSLQDNWSTHLFVIESFLML